MNNESRTLWLSVFAGLLSAFLLYSYSQEKKAEYDKDYGTQINVVIAKEDIPEMQTIDPTMLEVVQRPEKYVDPGVVKDINSIEGLVAGVPIKKGQQLLQNKLLSPGPDTGIALQVAPTKRAITLPVDEVRAVAKLIRPGDRIDIFAAIDSGKGLTQKRDIGLIMQDVVVLATGTNIVNNLPRSVEIDPTTKNVSINPLTGDTKYTSVTIEVSPKEAQDLIFILSTSPGNLFFTLRNPNDRAIVNRLPSSNSDAILGRLQPSDSQPMSASLPSYSPPPAAVAPTPNPAPTPQYYQQPGYNRTPSGASPGTPSGVPSGGGGKKPASNYQKL